MDIWIYNIPKDSLEDARENILKRFPGIVEEDNPARDDPVSKSFMVKIDKFPNPAEKDSEYPNLTFTDMAMLAYPDSTQEDWQ